MPYTPICIAKAVKNSAESDGMRRAHVSKAACAEERVSEGPSQSLACRMALSLAQGQKFSEPSSVNERMKSNTQWVRSLQSLTYTTKKGIDDDVS